ncbi:MAG: hypothetical protein Q8O88_00260 [bacterium]|jgi:AcrR family transcriptional regulator|nr:hypothetical protein [bacterium]
METENTIIIKKAREIIMSEGIPRLSIHHLANELNMEEEQLHHRFSNEDDIILLILSDFEREIKEYVHQFSNSHEPAETELKLLFKRLYFIFLQNPFYLSIIFDSTLIKRNEGVKKSILRIKEVAEKYLSTIIDAGKTENTFKTKVPTKVIAGIILSDFRTFMNDEYLLNEMVVTLKTKID